MSGRMKEGYRSKKLLENKIGFVSKTKFRVWPQNRASAFSRPNPQGLSLMSLETLSLLQKKVQES